SDLKEIEFLLYQGKYSSLKDSIEQKNLANLADIFVDSIPEMFTDEHALDYSSLMIFDEYDDDFLEVESDVKNVYDDPFDSKGEKIKESKLLIDELDLPYDYLPLFEIDAFPSTNNEDKIFNPGIIIQEKPVEIITRVVQDKKLAISNASLVLEDFDPPFYEPLFFKEVPKSNMLLQFSSENKEKVFKPGIHISEKVHSSFIPELSHQGYKPGHLAASLGCAETKVATWDDLAFKLITLGWNVKHGIFCKIVDPKLEFEFSTFTLMNNCR
nr:hypothetical protein [Tanacetum cinerariifolium]